MTTDPLARTACASLPAADLAALADLRRHGGIAVRLDGGRAWVRWDPTNAADREAVLRRLLPRAGVELYARRDGLWYRPGARLPDFGVPDNEGRPLHGVVFPAPVRPEAPSDPPPLPLALALVRDDRPRPSIALRCPIEALGAWADLATSAEIERLEASAAGGLALVVGRPLPAVAGAERFWGGLVLLPLGFRVEPELPEPAVRRALGASGGDRLLFTDGGAEVVPADAFRALSRASVRLALGGRGR